MVRFVVVLLLVSCVSVAQAEIIQFDITGLTGGSVDSLQLDSLMYSGPTGVVNSVSMRVTGVVTDLGEICCDPPENCPEDAYPWFMTWWGTVEHVDDPDPIHGKWVMSPTSYLDHLMTFDQTGLGENQNSFQSISNGDVFYVELYFGAAGWVGECEVTSPSAGTMYTVTVLMDVSFPLPTQPTTWGQVKTLFN